MYVLVCSYFVSSTGWLRDFANHHHFSSTRPRLAHRPTVTPPHLYYEYTFLTELQRLRPLYTHDLIINMDETMIRQVSGPRRVWGHRNHPWRNVNTKSNSKTGNKHSHSHSHIHIHIHIHIHAHTLTHTPQHVHSLHVYLIV